MPRLYPIFFASLMSFSVGMLSAHQIQTSEPCRPAPSRSIRMARPARPNAPHTFRF